MNEVCQKLIIYLFLENTNSVLIEYDQPIAYNNYGEISGFYICYKKSHECDKGATVKDWKSIG